MTQVAEMAELAHKAAMADAIIRLEGASWADYQRLLELRGEHAVPRLTYFNGSLELMTPSRSHEAIKSMLGCLLEAFCHERGVEISPYGSWTLENKESGRGLEPDECYVLGDVIEPLRPDLAIEVIWTSGGISKLAVYERLQVREVWIWQDGRLRLYGLRGTTYESLAATELFSGLDLTLLLSFVAVQPMTRAVRMYREALRQSENESK